MSGSKKTGRLRTFLVSIIDAMGAVKAGLKKIVLRILSFTESARKVLESILEAIIDFGRRLLSAAADLAVVAAQLLLFYIPSAILYFMDWPVSAVIYAVGLTLVGLLWIPFDRDIPTCLFDFFDTRFMRDRELLVRLVEIGKTRNRIETLLDSEKPILTPELAAHHLDRVDGMLKALNARLCKVDQEDRGGVIESAAGALEGYAARLEEFGRTNQVEDGETTGDIHPGREARDLTEEIEGLIAAMAEIGPDRLPVSSEGLNCVAETEFMPETAAPAPEECEAESANVSITTEEGKGTAASQGHSRKRRPEDAAR